MTSEQLVFLVTQMWLISAMFTDRKLPWVMVTVLAMLQTLSYYLL